MQTFDVYLRPAGFNVQFNVTGMGNARWLHSRLRQEYAMITPRSIQESALNDGTCQFEISCSPPVSVKQFEWRLKRMPSVNVVTAPK